MEWNKIGTDEYTTELDNGNLLVVFKEYDGKDLKWCWEEHSPEGMDVKKSASYFDTLQEAQRDAESSVTKVTSAVYAVANLTQKHRKETDQKEWALVSKKKPTMVLKWFGAKKPSEEQVAKEEKRIQYFKHLN